MNVAINIMRISHINKRIPHTVTVFVGIQINTLLSFLSIQFNLGFYTNKLNIDFAVLNRDLSQVLIKQPQM